MSKDKTCIKALFSICLMQQEILKETSKRHLTHIQEELDQLGEILYPKEKD